MTSIITAWLVKLATRILRDKLAALNDDTERLLLRLEARNHCVAYQEAENEKLIAQVTEYKDNNLILGIRVENLQVELEKLRTDNDVLRGQVKNQAAIIRDYQVGKKELQASIDVLQANVSGWSRLFAIIEHQMGVSRETADRLRREIDATPTEVQDSDAPRSGRVEASDFLDSIKPGDSLRIIDKAKAYFGHAKEWFTVREVNYGYHPNIPRFRVDGLKGDWHPFWFGLTDSDGLYLLTGAKERVNVATVQSPSTTGAGSASQTSDSAGGSAGGTADADIG